MLGLAAHAQTLLEEVIFSSSQVLEADVVSQATRCREIIELVSQQTDRGNIVYEYMGSLFSIQQTDCRFCAQQI